jgi:hypothetical protein
MPLNLDLIYTVFPEPIQSTVTHHGDDFYVVEVNAEWMFRFPRSQEATAALEIEKQFLGEFAPRLSHKSLHGSMACFEAFFSSVYTPVVIHGDCRANAPAHQS